MENYKEMDFEKRKDMDSGGASYLLSPLGLQSDREGGSAADGSGGGGFGSLPCHRRDVK